MRLAEHTRRRAFLALSFAALLCTGFLLSVWWAYTQDIQRARQRVHVGSSIAITPCGQIEYTVIGQGVPLVFSHGSGGGFDQGVDIAHSLARHGIQVILMSRFGYLRTPLPRDASAEAQADAHACLMDALQIERAYIAGASAGASSALQFAVRHASRTRGLVLIVPAVYAPRAAGENVVPAPAATKFVFEMALRSDFLFWSAIKVAPDFLTQAVLATPPALVRHASVDERQRVNDMITNILPVSERRLGLLNDGEVVSMMTRYPLEKITAPTLAISAKDDGYGTWESARYSVSQLPNARFVSYEHGGHVWVGHHDDVSAEIVRFVLAG
jgi:2-hydroxy-6-oxonona-2,4-dienedioate hydrolase